MGCGDAGGISSVTCIGQRYDTAALILAVAGPLYQPILRKTVDHDFGRRSVHGDLAAKVILRKRAAFMQPRQGCKLRWRQVWNTGAEDRQMTLIRLPHQIPNLGVQTIGGGGHTRLISASLIDSIACPGHNFICIRTILKAIVQVDYFRPDTLAEALKLAERDGIRIAAGCTDLFPATQRQQLIGPVLDITGISALRDVARCESGYRIGATATWTDIIRADLPPAFDGLKLAAKEVGAAQIQNSGTVAGNLCNASPAADGVPPLLALDAAVEIQSAAGQRSVLLKDFITGVRQTALLPGEIVTAVAVPASAGGASTFLKLGARKHLVISIVMVAARLQVEDGVVCDAAIAVGSCSPVAQRLQAVEARLIGQPADAALAMRVLESDIGAALSPIADIRADAGYRLDAATTLTRRAVTDLADKWSAVA